MTGLALESVTRTYAGVVALDDVSLAVAPDQLHCVVGPNGSGKTTLFRLLLGLDAPTSGRVRRPEGSVGAGFQRPRFYPRFTVAENVTVFGELVDAGDDWTASLLSSLGLDRARDRRAGALSGGYASRLDLALALIGRPDVVLVDEPLGDLDAGARRDVVALLADYCTDGQTAVVATHRFAAFDDRWDRLTVLDRGRVALDVDDPSAPLRTNDVPTAVQDVLGAGEQPTDGAGE